MLAKPPAGVRCAALLALLLGAGTALAEPPATDAPPGPPSAGGATPVAPAAAAPTPATVGHGVIVVSLDDGAAEAARALAFEVYRDAALRPVIDEPTARVLAGAPAAAGAPAKVKDLGDLRQSIGRAGSETAARRLLASLGAELGAELVVAVASHEGALPGARILRTADATAYVPLELGSVAPSAEAPAARWPTALPALRGLVTATPPPEAAPPPASAGPVLPLASAATAPALPLATKEAKPIWTNPWFWGALGGVVGVSVGIYAISRAASPSNNVHLQGKVGP